MKYVFLSTDKKMIKRIYNNHLNDSSVILDNHDVGKVDTKDVEVIFSTWNMPVFTKESIKSYFPSLKAVFYAAGTVKYFAKSYFDLGIKIFNSDKVNCIPVAEFTASQIILAGKGYFQSALNYRKMRFKSARHIAENHYGNYKAKVGIIGAGNIGKLVIELLKPYKLEILVNDLKITEEDALAIGSKKATLQEIFEECDVISNHLPDLESTKNILNYDLFHRMKPYATFINTGRGAQIDDKGLRKAMKESKGRCALIDVLRHEPILPWSPLFGVPNIFITPHIAGSLSEEVERMGDAMFDAFNDYCVGKKSNYEVDQDSLTLKA